MWCHDFLRCLCAKVVENILWHFRLLDPFLSSNWIFFCLALQLRKSSIVFEELYSIQHYVIKFVSDMCQVGGFLPGILVSSTNKTDHHDITEILLKMVLNTITLSLTLYIFSYSCTFISFLTMSYSQTCPCGHLY
jgi:hypothetical protein